MPTQSFPNVNGDVCSWADIAVSLNVPGGAEVGLFDLEALKWSDKVEVGEQRGTSGGRVMGTTRGSLSSEASATISRAGARQFIQALAVAAAELPNATRGDRVAISGVRFDILVQHTPLGTEAIFTTKLSGCRFLGRSHDYKQGNEAEMVEIVLNPIEIAEQDENGQWIVLL